MAEQVYRVGAVPLGAEVTGLALHNDDLFFNYQHPDTDLSAPLDHAGVGVVADATFDNPLALPTGPARSAVSTSLGDYQLLATAGQDGAGMVGDRVIEAPDFNSYLPTSATTGELFTSWEAIPAGMSVLSLERADDGHYRVLGTRMLDFASVDGVWLTCFGTTSPWNTPLASEELTDADTSEWTSSADAEDRQRLADQIGRAPNPYDYGYIVEITDPLTNPTPVKQFALGRFSHEVSVVMPDERTVYLTDDISGDVIGGALFKFVADTAGDLSAGTLYAAKVTQLGAAGTAIADVRFSIEWIELAHGDHDTIEQWIDSYDSVATEGVGNYLSDADIDEWATGAADDDRVAFLESRKAAAAVGATAEWQKLEGINVNFDQAASGAHPMMYLAVSRITHKMSDGSGAIDVAENPCGAVLQLPLDAEWNATQIFPFVVGGPLVGDGQCDPNNLAGPDNLIVLPDGSVLIGEDTSYHQNNMLWIAR